MGTFLWTSSLFTLLLAVGVGLCLLLFSFSSWSWTSDSSTTSPYFFSWCLCWSYFSSCTCCHCWQWSPSTFSLPFFWTLWLLNFCFLHNGWWPSFRKPTFDLPEAISAPTRCRRTPIDHISAFPILLPVPAAILLDPFYISFALSCSLPYDINTSILPMTSCSLLCLSFEDSDVSYLVLSILVPLSFVFLTLSPLVTCFSSFLLPCQLIFLCIFGGVLW